MMKIINFVPFQNCAKREAWGLRGEAGCKGREQVGESRQEHHQEQQQPSLCSQSCCGYQQRHHLHRASEDSDTTPVTPPYKTHDVFQH